MDPRKERLDRERQYHDSRYSEELREAAAKYYSIHDPVRRRYRELVMSKKPDVAVELGCGPQGLALELAAAGTEVMGVDISPVAVARARAEAEERGTTVKFEVMDAESLSVEASSADVVCGSGILHHLDSERAFAEIARVLREDGRAVFVEPLGHNPVINVYRRFTPKMRTVDEHPLRRRDLLIASRFFESVELETFQLLTLAAVPFRRTALFNRMVALFTALDRGLLRRRSPLKWLAWVCVLRLERPLPAPR